MIDFNFKAWTLIISITTLSIVFFFLLIKVIFFIKRNWFKLNYSSFKNNKNKYTLQEIGRALEILSSKKIGASIIFERNSDISSFLVFSGTKINSILSSDLIITIFAYKKNQLHDGAMIVNSNFKIKSAGNFLPIKETKILGSSFGTRHRSVYTLTSMTKAIGIVVSETDGYISCFSKKTLSLKTRDTFLVLEWLKKKI